AASDVLEMNAPASRSAPMATERGPNRFTKTETRVGAAMFTSPVYHFQPCGEGVYPAASPRQRHWEDSYGHEALGVSWKGRARHRAHDRRAGVDGMQESTEKEGGEGCRSPDDVIRCDRAGPRRRAAPGEARRIHQVPQLPLLRHSSVAPPLS